MIRNSFPLCILILVLLLGCKSKPKASQEINTTETMPVEEKSTEKVSQHNGRAPVRMISIEKTACYGTCPIYKAEIWSDQRLIWYGEQFVKPLGKYEFEDVPQVLIADILDYAQSISYHSSFDTVYKSLLMDLPTTIVSVMENGTGRVKSVRVHGEAPKRLVDFQDYVHKRITKYVNDNNATRKVVEE